MTHAESKERRARIAARARLGGTLAEIAKDFPDVCRWTIYGACREHGVCLERPVQPYSVGMLHPFRVLAKLKHGASDTAIGKEYHVSRERIRQIKELAIELGLLET